MLLMQYNDNIPAVFGFPLVIPHQRGGTEEEEKREERGGGQREGEHTVLGNAWLFLSPLLVLIIIIIISPFFSLLFLPSSCPPSQACGRLRGQNEAETKSTVCLYMPVCIHE